MKLGLETPAVVSGGASGLGAAVARALRQRGVPVGLLDLNAALGETYATEIGASFAHCDVSDAASVSAALASIRANQGQERVVVNCAGVAPAVKTISRNGAHDSEVFRKTIDANLIGTFNVASKCALGMSTTDPVNGDGERGVIVNTASIAAFEGQMGQVAYAASKAGVVGLTLPMARDLAKHGIRVIAIAPGIFETPMVTSFPEELQQSLAQMSEFPKRLGQVEEFASLVLDIIGNTMLNGTTIRLDGGARLPSG